MTGGYIWNSCYATGRRTAVHRTASVGRHGRATYAFYPKAPFGIAGPNVSCRIDTEHWNAKIGKTVQ